MANSEITIDSIENLKLARSFDNKLSIKVHRVGALSKNLDGKELVNFNEFVDEGITIFSDDGKTLIDDDLSETAFKKIAELSDDRNTGLVVIQFVTVFSVISSSSMISTISKSLINNLIK